MDVDAEAPGEDGGGQFGGEGTQCERGRRPGAARRLRPVLAESLDEALALKARHPDWATLKDGPPAPGFDAVNSPGLLRSLDLGGRTVVQKTTAGTVGALAVKEASLVLCAGFVVAEATARLLRTRGCGSVTFVVTGDDGHADEDLACAQYIARRATEAGTDAAEFLRRAGELRAAAELAEGVRQGVHPDDVALCLELDRFSFAMVATLEDSLMVLRPCAAPSPTDEAGDRARPLPSGPTSYSAS